MEVRYNGKKITVHALLSLASAAALIEAPDVESIEVIYSLDEVYQLRANAYKAESDPLYMAWQFDQTPEAEQAWRAKVEEIKARYPKPAA